MNTHRHEDDKATVYPFNLSWPHTAQETRPDLTRPLLHGKLLMLGNAHVC